jgi:hypothetical protein
MPATTQMMFTRELTRGTHHRRFTVEVIHPDGWIIRDQQDRAIVREVQYQDWHRVELAMQAFAVEAIRLKSDGWVAA